MRNINIKFVEKTFCNPSLLLSSITLMLKSSRKRRRGLDLLSISVSSDLDGSSFYSHDYTYNSITRRKRHRISISNTHAPPLPSSTNSFPFHTPPSTPSRKQLISNGSEKPQPFVETICSNNCSVRPLKLFNLLNINFNQLFDLSKQNLYTIKEAPEEVILEPAPQVNMTYEPISFVEQEQDPVSHANTADFTSIAEFSDKYYPHILSLHARQTLAGHVCATPGCVQHSDPLYHCAMCLSNDHYCQNCIKNMHIKLPFHRIHSWDEASSCYIP